MPKLVAQKFHVSLFRDSLKETIKDLNLIQSRLNREKAFLKEFHSRLCNVLERNKEILTEIHRLESKDSLTDDEFDKLLGLRKKRMVIEFIIDDETVFY